jgi:hypothetical protein
MKSRPKTEKNAKNAQALLKKANALVRKGTQFKSAISLLKNCLILRIATYAQMKLFQARQGLFTNAYLAKTVKYTIKTATRGSAFAT